MTTMTPLWRSTTTFVLLSLAACTRSAPETAPVPAEPEPGLTLSSDAYRIIPRPTEIEPRPGAVALDAITQIVLSDVRDTELQSLANFARRILQNEIGIAPRVSPSAEASAPAGALALFLRPDATNTP